MAIKSICRQCKYHHGYYREPLKKNESFCRHLGNIQKNKRNCIHFEEANSTKDTSK